jgi:hypothetical protein
MRKCLSVRVYVCSTRYNLYFQLKRLGLLVAITKLARNNPVMHSIPRSVSYTAGKETRLVVCLRLNVHAHEHRCMYEHENHTFSLPLSLSGKLPAGSLELTPTDRHLASFMVRTSAQVVKHLMP